MEPERQGSSIRAVARGAACKVCLDAKAMISDERLTMDIVGVDAEHVGRGRTGVGRCVSRRRRVFLRLRWSERLGKLREDKVGLLIAG